MKPITIRLFLLSMCIISCSTDENITVTLKKFESFALTDTTLDLTNSGGVKVVSFVSYHCPIAIRQFERLNKMIEKFPDVDFLLVIPEKDFELRTEFVQDRIHKVQGSILIDCGLELTNKLGATVTPEYFVFNEADLVFQGPLDNTYAGIDKPQFDRKYENYVEKALISIALNKTPTETYIKPVGCFIQ